MSLLNIFGNKSSLPEPEYFLAVEIHESLIKTALWELDGTDPRISSIGSYESWFDEESLINGVDASLTQAVRTLKTTPQKVVFGLPDSWLTDKGIHESKNRLISRIIRQLGLEPIGVVPINQSIAHYLKKENGVPPTAILVEVYTSKIAVSVFETGLVKSVEEVARSGDLAHDVEEGLARMDLKTLPPRIYLTNGSELENEEQQMTAYPWTERLPFSHLPKVQVLPLDYSVTAVALMGGSEAIRALGIEVDTGEEPLPETESDNLAIPSDQPSHELESLGFSYEETSPPKEVSRSAHKSEEPVEESTSETENNQSDFEPLDPENTPDETDNEPDYAISSTEIEDRDKRVLQGKIQSRLSKISLPSLPKISLEGTATTPYIIGAVSLFAITLITTVCYFFLAKAQISLIIKPIKQVETVDIVISEQEQTDTPTLIASKKTVTASLKDSIPTTGETTVGDRAKGQVTIYNTTVAPLVLKAGSKLADSTGKMIYTIDSAVTIASASMNFVGGTQVFGKQDKVSVTASRIGAEYNLSKDSTLSVENFSKTVSYAVVESDLAGGSSRSVRAVGKDDIEKLLTQATEKIKQQTQEQIATETPGKESLALSDIVFTEKKFDKAAGEEANTLNINLSASLDLLVYSKSDLMTLLSKQIANRLQPGTVVSTEESKISLENPQKAGSNFSAKAIIEAVSYPEIDQAKYSALIAGRHRSEARRRLEMIPGFQEASVKINFPVPVISNYLPLKNIEFSVRSQ